MAWLTDEDLYYWDQGTLAKSYEKLGAHPTEGGVWFAVWAPSADLVEVIGSWNDWDGSTDTLHPDGSAWIDGNIYRIEFCSVSERLARGVQHLLLRFGINAKLRSHRRTNSRPLPRFDVPSTKSGFDVMT